MPKKLWDGEPVLKIIIILMEVLMKTIIEKKVIQTEKMFKEVNKKKMMKTLKWKKI